MHLVYIIVEVDTSNKVQDQSPVGFSDRKFDDYSTQGYRSPNIFLAIFFSHTKGP